MSDENLTFYEPDAHQLAKFYNINSLPDKDWELRCLEYDDCSICPMAIHQYLLSTTKHRCTYGLSEMEFRILMSDADCEY